MNIFSIFRGHDPSFCVFNNGVPYHVEYEKYIHQKNAYAHPLDVALEVGIDVQNMDCFVIGESNDYNTPVYNSIVEKFVKENRFYSVGHHTCHAANAFFSSNFNKSLIVTIDGGGNENGKTVQGGVYYGCDNKIQRLEVKPLNMHIALAWQVCGRWLFRLYHPCKTRPQGTMMAMAAYGKPDKRYIKFFTRMIENGKPPGIFNSPPGRQPKSASFDQSKEPWHHIMGDMAKLAEKNEQERFNMAAGLQIATENALFKMMEYCKNKYKNDFDIKNMCIAGGVALNSAGMGKIASSGMFDQVYIPPGPGDDGLPLGAAQYVYHQIHGKERIDYRPFFSPYMGYSFTSTEINASLNKVKNDVHIKSADTDEVVNLLNDGNIISVFGGKTESGKRALGNRSILADPRRPDMKDVINEKVKHRQWFRPFAPAILEEKAKKWFSGYVDSPYMSFVAQFKKEKKSLVPAVVHPDGSGRLQRVNSIVNPWFHELLLKWNEKTGVPILLNTSFNDQTPICNTPDHAIKCFLDTDIDYLYFFDVGILVSK